MRIATLFPLLVLLTLSVFSFGRDATVAYPKIVASVSLPGQTNSIPPTTLLTSQNNSLYRITAYGLALNGDASIDREMDR
jgi:hypothetical protein